MSDFLKIETISKLNSLINYDKPLHPLISVIDFSSVNLNAYDNLRLIPSFYCILLKEIDEGVIRYGRNKYDFQDGSLFFLGPNQVVSLQTEYASDEVFGWGIFFHPDLLKGTSLDRKIHQFNVFNYSVNEALHLSDKEKSILTNIVGQIKLELEVNIDKHSKSVLVANIELLLNYCVRYYDRQFITRSEVNKDVLTAIEAYLISYFNSDKPRSMGLPTVQQLADIVNLSPNYLSGLLKQETGKSAQEHIHFYLLDKAKTVLLNSNNTVNEIAYSLGFEYPHYFSKIFKAKTGYTPRQFRDLN